VPFRREGFATLLGAELHAPETALGEDWHLLTVCLPPDFPPTSAEEGGPDLADALLAEGRRINAFAADDAHLRKGAPDAFGGWVQVRSEALEPEPILAALKAGHYYYSSQGPEIHGVEVGEGSVLVRCAPARGTFLGGRGRARAQVLGEGITECELPTDLFVGGSHLRVTVVDAAGRRAWTNPLWLDRG
jgi:hypothetical protein